MTILKKKIASILQAGILLCLCIPAILSCEMPESASGGSQAGITYISRFAFLKTDNPSLPFDLSGDVHGDLTISMEVPFGTDVTALVPDLSTLGSCTITPAPGTPVNFTMPVIYTLSAPGAETHSYTVTLTVLSQEETEGNTLSGLSLSCGGLTFQTGVENYPITVGKVSASTRITPVTSFPRAVIKVGTDPESAAEVKSGSASNVYPLPMGESSLFVYVTSFLRVTRKYTITVTCGAPPMQVTLNTWCPGTLTYPYDEYGKDGGETAIVPTIPGQRYRIAVDGNETEGWTTTNGGWADASGSGPGADVFYRVFRPDGVTGYEYEEPVPFVNMNGESLTGWVEADSGSYYVTVTAQDTTLVIRMNYFMDYGSFAIQVRLAQPAPEPARLEAAAWSYQPFPSDPWTCEYWPAFLVDTVPGEEYRVAVDRAYTSNDIERGWYPGNGGSEIIPSAKTVEYCVYDTSGNEIPYLEGGSGWIYGDWFDITPGQDHKYMTVRAPGSSLIVKCRNSAAVLGSGTFAVQVRPVIISRTELTGDAWDLQSFSLAETCWENIKEYTRATTAGRQYRLGIDDRDNDASLGWTAGNGGYQGGTQTGFVYARAIRQDGITDYSTEEGQTGWQFIDEGTGTWLKNGLTRYMTVTSVENTLTLQVRGSMYLPGTFAIWMREIPDYVALTPGAAWTAGSVGTEQSWQMENKMLYSFPATIGATYRIMVDDRGDEWTPSNGGMTVSPTSDVMLVASRGDRTIYSPTIFNADIAPNKYFELVAQDTTVFISVYTLNPPYAGTFGIRVEAQ